MKKYVKGNISILNKLVKTIESSTKYMTNQNLNNIESSW